MRKYSESADRLAEKIVGVLSTFAMRVECTMDPSDIRYAVRSRSLKLRSIVLNRASLRRLLTATNGLVKIEYLKRDLLRTAVQRAEYRYPRRGRGAAITDSCASRAS
jgi:hypothetical protein